jgi:hypothetical protein
MNPGGAVMSRWKWIPAAVMAVSAAQAGTVTNFFADFETSANGPAGNKNLHAGTEIGGWNARIPSGSFITNGVLHLGPGCYGYQIWIPPRGVKLSARPSVHMELLASTPKETDQWNLIVFKDPGDRNLLSLRFNAWSALQRWTGEDWAGPLGVSDMRGGSGFPVVLNELDIDFFPDGADIYYNGALVEQAAPYLPYAAEPVIRHIALTGPSIRSAAWLDNIHVESWVGE